MERERGVLGWREKGDFVERERKGVCDFFYTEWPACEGEGKLVEGERVFL